MTAVSISHFSRRRAGSGSDEPPIDVDQLAGPVADFLSADHWTAREIETPEPLLGEIITNTTRMFIGGATGIGKTHIGLGMAGGMATGTGFLHWKASRPSRVLYIDGEMARDLMQERIIDLMRRMDVPSIPGLFVLCREDCEEMAKRFAGIGEMQPLNTPEGQEFIRLLVKLVKPDVIIFDNRMSLLSGDMKEEQPWTETMGMVKDLTRQRIAQVWFDHTGHDSTRIYGTKTKEWQFDSVVMLKKEDGDEDNPPDVCVSLEFTKARRRKPSNRADFDPVTVSLADDGWTVEGASKNEPAAPKPPSPKALAFHRALLDAIIAHGTNGTCTLKDWRAECCRTGVLDKLPATR